MNPVAKLGAFGLLLIVVLGGGALVGRAVGPIDTERRNDHAVHDEPAAEATRELPAGGLLVSQDGYTFEPDSRTLGAAPFSFRITGPDDRPVTDYEELHDRELHLIVVSRDLRHYAHLHPTRAVDGTWSVAVPTLPAGAYRAFADLRPAGGEQLTLGIDVQVPGATGASQPLEPTSHDHVDGFEVSLAIHEETATVTVRRDGQVVTTEPYLGAAGHLVALRDGDLAYLHVHPLDEAPSGPVGFAVDHPSDGRYALFFDFQVGGQVRTARFVIDATGGTTAEHGGH